MTKYEQALETNKRKIFFNNMIGGLGWALGSTIGLTLFAAILTFLLSKIDLIPVIGSYIAKINAFIEANPVR